MLPSMSLIGGRSRLLSLAPHVIVGETWLLAKTHGLWVALSLLSYRRQLHVDARTRKISWSERRLWRTRRIQLGFDAIDHIEYAYSELPTSFFSGILAGRLSVHRADSMERFQVNLVLEDEQRLPLFSFLGEGSKMTGLVGALLGDDLVDLEGNQEEESYGFVKQLQRLTQLRLGSALPHALAQRLSAKCNKCGQANVPRARCLYCGAELS